MKKLKLLIRSIISEQLGSHSSDNSDINPNSPRNYRDQEDYIDSRPTLQKIQPFIEQIVDTINNSPNNEFTFKLPSNIDANDLFHAIDYVKETIGLYPQDDFKVFSDHIHIKLQDLYQESLAPQDNDFQENPNKITKDFIKQNLDLKNIDSKTEYSEVFDLTTIFPMEHLIDFVERIEKIAETDYNFPNQDAIIPFNKLNDFNDILTFTKDNPDLEMDISTFISNILTYDEDFFIVDINTQDKTISLINLE